MTTKQIVEKTDLEVSKDDQNNINNFSKYNQQYHELIRDLDRYKEQLRQLEDCSTELELYDDDEIRVKFGECFCTVDIESSKELIETNNTKIKGEAQALQTKIAEIEKKMKKLKATLYAKFGASINLEE